MQRLLVALAVLCLFGAASATVKPGCISNQASMNWNYIEFHDIDLQPLDVVIQQATIVVDFDTQQLLISGDFVGGQRTSFIGSVYVEQESIYMAINGGCYQISDNTTGIFDQQCVQNDTVARVTTMGSNDVLVFRDDVSFPTLNVNRRTFTYWTTNGVPQPLAWQSMFTNPAGQQVGTASWVSDGYVPTADPSVLVLPRSCTAPSGKWSSVDAAVKDMPSLLPVRALLNAWKHMF
jgi:hypothetical protein